MTAAQSGDVRETNGREKERTGDEMGGWGGEGGSVNEF